MGMGMEMEGFYREFMDCFALLKHVIYLVLEGIVLSACLRLLVLMIVKYYMFQRGKSLDESHIFYLLLLLVKSLYT